MSKTLFKIIEPIDRDRNNLVIIGDFNIDYTNKKTLQQTGLSGLETKYSLAQQIKHHTRISRESKTTIDLIYTDMKNITKCGVLNYDVSDHLPIFFVKKQQRIKMKKKITYGRSYKRYNVETFLRLLDNQNWENYFEITNPEYMWQIFIRNITLSLDVLCPVKQLIVVDTKPRWLSNALLLQMRERDKAFKKARRTQLSADWNIAKLLRNNLSTGIKIAKSNFVKTELEKNRNNPRKFWNQLNELLPTSKNEDIQELHDEITSEVFGGERLNDHINDYFANIGPLLAAKCTPGPTPDVVHDHNVHANIEWNFNRTPFTEEEVHIVCKSIDVNKSSALTNIKTMVLKDAFLSRILELVWLFNCSMQYSIFPDSWKLSSIVPLPKVSNPKLASELRPVALTPLPGKIMEKLMCSRLQLWLDNNKLLTNCQHGFRKGRSTVTAVCAFLNIIYTFINENKNPIVIFLDLKKAFDTVSHSKLLLKMEKMGLDNISVQWFRSYLENRKQCVIMNNMTSNTLPITYGVPQGSILGPVLFSMYINEIPNTLSCNVVLYADDTVILHDDVHILQDNLNVIVSWCNENQLTINTKKSQWMRLNICTDQIDPLAIKISNNNLERVKEYKYLGVHVDCQLNFQHHNKLLTRNVNYKISHFKRIRKFITKMAAELIYKCTILPILEYADFIIDQGVEYVNNALQKIQNQCLLIVHNQHFLKFNERDSTETLHRNTKIFRLAHRRRIHLLQFAYSFRECEEMVDNRNIRTRRRGGIVFKIVHSNHYKFYKNPIYRCSVEWNRLDVQTSLIEDKTEFINTIKKSIPNPFAKIL